jgi:hypothetical protein
MTIHRLLQDASFDQPMIASIVAAYDAALKLIQLTDRDDAVTEIVAKKIIQVARGGVRDPAHICALALLELGVELPPS